MFGWRRKRVTKHVTEMTRQILVTFQAGYGTPVDFWCDEFVIGFFGGMIGILQDIIGKGRLGPMDQKMLFRDVFSSLSGLDGRALTIRFFALEFEDPLDEDFNHGQDGAMVIALSMIGNLYSWKHVNSSAGRILEGHRREIEESGRDLAEGTAVTLEMLTERFFVNPLIDRFGLNGPRKPFNIQTLAHLEREARLAETGG